MTSFSLTKTKENMQQNNKDGNNDKIVFQSILLKLKIKINRIKTTKKMLKKITNYSLKKMNEKKTKTKNTTTMKQHMKNIINNKKNYSSTKMTN